MSSTVSIPETTRRRLEMEADRSNRSADQIADAAINVYLRSEEIERQIIAERIRKADEGKFVSSEAMLRWISSWDTNDELPPPKADLDFGPRKR